MKSTITRLEKLEQQYKPEKPIKIHLPKWLSNLAAGKTIDGKPRLDETNELNAVETVVHEFCKICDSEMRAIYSVKGLVKQCSNPNCLSVL